VLDPLVTSTNPTRMNPQENQAVQRKPQLKETQRLILVIQYLLLTGGGTRRAPAGSVEALSDRYKVSTSYIQKLYRTLKRQLDDNVLFPVLVTPNPRAKGPSSWLDPMLAECLFEFNSMEGFSMPIRDFTIKFNEIYGTEFSHQTLHKYAKKLNVRFGRSFVKPLLKDRHLINRLRFILADMDPVGEEGDYVFKSMEDVIHIDEKWFFATREQRRYRYFPGDEHHPDEQTQHKNAIQKIMFLCAVAVPQVPPPPYAPFDGKIGIFPLAEEILARRNSVNRPAGTVLLNPFSMTAEEYLIQITQEGGLLDKIKEKMPWRKNFQIRIQHDNATPHTGKDNKFLLNVAGTEDGWNIEFYFQPSQSPDLNVLDLCLFHSLQRGADKIRGPGKSLLDIRNSVLEHWNNYDSAKLTRAFALLAEVKRQILLVGGKNTYKTPHSNIRKRQNDGEAPVIDLRVPREIRLAGVEALDRLENGNPPDESESDDSDEELFEDGNAEDFVEAV
jgi:hypothetical protein